MWQFIRRQIPLNIQELSLRLLAVLLFLSVTRIVFYSSNSDAFSHVVWSDWTSGIWFDLVTISLLFSPFIVLSLVPVNWQKPVWVRWLKNTAFYIPFFLVIALNLVDTEYFKFTQKRSTADLFAIVSAGNDVGQLLTSFIRDFWILILAFICLVIGIIWLYRKSNFRRWKNNSLPISTRKELLFLVVLLPAFLIIGRGGFSLKPIASIDATLYTEPQNTALILNTPFTILKSIGKDDLVEINYFTNKELDRIYSPFQSSEPQNILPDGTNVMVIMLESFGNEWVGKFNQSTSYTPFLDSLLDESWYFEHGFSNGKKSIEGVPNIVASIPTWMDNPYISSAYCNNTFQAIPEILTKKGYSSAFYHGATNGSMRFNSYTKQVGFQEYIGRYEYNNDAHFDQTWGILDEYFNPWTAQQLTKQKTPFFATLFTLSSHHPYYVPPAWKNKVKKGPNPICKSINYGDISLRKFFEQAKKEPWFANTLFVLVADHTPSTESKIYSHRTQMYQIPIAFYHPSGKLPKRKDSTIFQQLDILPTVLDLVNIKTDYYAFGHSYFSKEPREALTYLEGTYYYFRDGKMLAFSNNKAIKMVDFSVRKRYYVDELKTNQKVAKQYEYRMRALIQRYNNDLIHNRMRLK